MTLALLLLALALTLIFDVAGAIFALLGLPVSMRFADWGFPGFNAVIGLAAVLCGWPIARTRPRNPIGWLLVGIGLLSAAQFAAHYYATLGLVAAPGSVPGASVGAWLEGWLWVPTVGSAAVLMPIVFPTGRPLTPRWWPLVWVALAGTVVATLGFLLEPELTRAQAGPNPFFAGTDPALSGAIIGLGMLTLVGSMLLGAISLVLRFRRSHGIERQQLKWLALAVAAAAVAFGIYACLLVLTGRVDNPLTPLVALSFVGVVAAVSIAILRHRLLDIDLLINRALVYAGVTVVLGAVYVGAVLVLQQLLTSFTEQQGLVVAGSTLLVAALFAPVRRRMQRAVDRRFYRSRYDAERVVQAFAMTVRDEVDLPSLTDELASVADRTVRPTRSRVWLRHHP
jgi:hypothetical protein